MSNKTTRKEFIRKSTCAAAGISLGVSAIGSPALGSVLGANDKVRVGFIGVGNRGTQLMTRFMANDDVEVAALSDVYEPYMDRDYSKVSEKILAEVGDKVPKMGEKFSGKVGKYKDFRKLLDLKDIDAVCIATPDHWHAIQTIMALDAGKDIYVEKPLTITLYEGRRMIEAAAKTDRIIQVGLNRRGSSIYQSLAKMIRDGKIGKVSLARAYRISNMYPDGIGKAKGVRPPRGFDWDMWLGPRAKIPYQYNIAPYKFRWWKDYSTQMGNWGVHYMDAIRWMMGEEAPTAISAHGGKYVLDDDRTIPDTMEVTFEFASGAIIAFGIYEASGGSMIVDGEIELRGTKGNLISSQSGYRFEPNEGGQFQDRDGLIKPEEYEFESDQSYGDLGIKEDSTANLIRNFLDCVKSRARDKVMCDLETGHRSTSFAHLANIALEVGDRLEWDTKNERFINNEAANELLHYEYRKPWILG
ncbi:MAG: Gfo/Idh/MocA family oxidoreductase [Fidelibacterota bacterium]|nr:MAG: Gfo/Idh/MocA family oxidoreductase [Candidatus Neomarinimicrobiota bacterium]